MLSGMNDFPETKENKDVSGLRSDTILSLKYTQ